jgi:hypothetical protein
MPNLHPSTLPRASTAGWRVCDETDAPGEGDAALLACNRLLEARGMGWSDVAALIDRHAAAAR